MHIILVESNNAKLNQEARQLLMSQNMNIKIMPFDRDLARRLDLPLIQIADGRRYHGIVGIQTFVRRQEMARFFKKD